MTLLYIPKLNVLKSIWQKNSFPLFFIDKYIERFLDKLFIKLNISGTVSMTKEVFICLEFLGKMSYSRYILFFINWKRCQEISPEIEGISPNFKNVAKESMPLHLLENDS